MSKYNISSQQTEVVPTHAPGSVCFSRKCVSLQTGHRGGFPAGVAHPLQQVNRGTTRDSLWTIHIIVVIVVNVITDKHSPPLMKMPWFISAILVDSVWKKLICLTSEVLNSFQTSLSLSVTPVSLLPSPLSAFPSFPLSPSLYFSLYVSPLSIPRQPLLSDLSFILYS